MNHNPSEFKDFNAINIIVQLSRNNSERFEESPAFFISNYIAQKADSLMNSHIFFIPKDDPFENNYSLESVLELRHKIITSLIAMYFTDWLKASMVQDIVAYRYANEYLIRSGFEPKTDDFDNERRRWYHTIDKYYSYLQMFRRQTELKRRSIRDDFDDKRLSEFEAWWVEKAYEGGFDIIDLYYNREMLRVSSKRDNKALREAYIRFYELFHDLQTGPDRHSLDKETANRRYVIAATQLLEFEYTCRFHLVSLIARRYTDFVPDVSKRITRNKFIKVFPQNRYDNLWGRIDPKEDYVEFSYDILNYSYELDCLLYGSSLVKDNFSQDVLWNINWHKAYRKMTCLLYRTIKLNLPLEDLPSWTSADYGFATKFFYSDYPIYKIYDEACGTEKTPEVALGEADNVYHRSTYDYIRAFYLHQKERATQFNNTRDNG